MVVVEGEGGRKEKGGGVEVGFLSFERYRSFDERPAESAKSALSAGQVPSRGARRIILGSLLHQ
jgi:hypothetical protein